MASVPVQAALMVSTAALAVTAFAQHSQVERARTVPVMQGSMTCMAVPDQSSPNGWSFQAVPSQPGQSVTVIPVGASTAWCAYGGFKPGGLIQPGPIGGVSKTGS